VSPYSYKFLYSLLKHRSASFALLLNYLNLVDSQNGGFWGGITKTEEEALTDLVRTRCLSGGPIIELGTLFGHTSLLLASLKSSEQELFTVDNYSWNPFMMSAEDHEQFTLRCLRGSIGSGRVKVIKSDIARFQADYRGPTPSLVFIDADHQFESVKADIEWAVKTGSEVICGHDYSDQWPSVKRAVNQVLGAGNFLTHESLWWTR